MQPQNQTQKTDKYYYDGGLLYKVSEEIMFAMIQGKGWMTWANEDVVNENNLVTEDEARKIVENLGELF